DCDFGPDGAFYVSDWVQGWGKTGKGRLYRVTDPEQMKKPVVAEVKQLLAEGFDQRPVEELLRLLGHPHQQVRTEAQFALVERKERPRNTRKVKWEEQPARPDAGDLEKVVAGLVQVAEKGTNRLARLHAVWGLGQLGAGQAPRGFEPLRRLVKDRDSE